MSQGCETVLHLCVECEASLQVFLRRAALLGHQFSIVRDHQVSHQVRCTEQAQLMRSWLPSQATQETHQQYRQLVPNNRRLIRGQCQTFLEQRFHPARYCCDDQLERLFCHLRTDLNLYLASRFALGEHDGHRTPQPHQKPKHRLLHISPLPKPLLPLLEAHLQLLVSAQVELAPFPRSFYIRYKVRCENFQSHDRSLLQYVLHPLQEVAGSKSKYQ